MSECFAVAIDGPVAAGKTTVGRLLARELSALFFDTGIVYRAAAHQTLAQGVDPEDADAVAAIAEQLDLQLLNTANGTRLIVDGRDITDELRSPEVDRALPPISANPRVREALLECQRSAVDGLTAVVVGRDIGTVILPDADLKIYLDSGAEVRAHRRHQELRDRGVDISWETVYRDLQARDARDTSRDHAPLEIADGAIVVDATDKGVDEVVQELLGLVRERQKHCDTLPE